ncbi:hypothetical protein BT96DRAFT_927191 [Gymnopus androsaceus JB14]|uniref:Lytic polysaccharide monooxygenase n=1 Tax=Gymnopus androsaceus JB14 TaxID=1447944 RepID=A0A6A4GRJ9_9AGAR|nr:hypothetical protein BT96DRAFT_927191 [Gymnopus androsaceus JB14]
MWGFNVTEQSFPYDNRPVSPLTNYTFDEWWFHGHLDFPPHASDVLQLPVNQSITTEIACDKGATSFFASNPGGDIQDGDNVCPGSPIAEFHTTGFDDLKGCALAIAYKSNVSEVTPEDFTVFSVNQTCVWTRFTDFQIPERMPACPDGLCTCAWFWIHSPDSGGEQNYMTGFQCNITGATSDVPLAKPQVPRRCGADPDNGKQLATLSNCTYGAKQPFYWLQAENNTMFEGSHAPPFYNDLYNFIDGAQNDIFEDSYISIPAPSPVAALPFLNQTVAAGVNLPFAGNVTTTRSESNTTELNDACLTVGSSNTKRSITGTHEGWKRSRIAAHLHQRRERENASGGLAWALFGWKKM